MALKCHFIKFTKTCNFTKKIIQSPGFFFIFVGDGILKTLYDLKKPHSMV